jgi:hypothetical protein
MHHTCFMKNLIIRNIFLLGNVVQQQYWWSCTPHLTCCTCLVLPLCTHCSGVYIHPQTQLWVESHIYVCFYYLHQELVKNFSIWKFYKWVLHTTPTNWNSTCSLCESNFHYIYIYIIISIHVQSLFQEESFKVVVTNVVWVFGYINNLQFEVFEILESKKNRFWFLRKNIKIGKTSDFVIFQVLKELAVFMKESWVF